MSDKYDGLQQIIDEALGSMAAEAGGDFDPQRCNLAEFCRRTGLSRQRARTIKANGFKARPHGRLGQKLAKTVLSGHTGFVDDQLRKGVTNSQVVFERLAGQGYRGGLTTVKVYMADHRDLVPAKRRAVAPQGSRGQRCQSCPPCANRLILTSLDSSLLLQRTRRPVSNKLVTQKRIYGSWVVIVIALPIPADNHDQGLGSSHEHCTLVPQSQRKGASLEPITEHARMRMYQDVFRHTPHLLASLLRGCPSTMPSAYSDHVSGL